MEQVTQPLFTPREIIDCNIILIPEEWLNRTGTHTIHSLSGPLAQKVQPRRLQRMQSIARNAEGESRL